MWLINSSIGKKVLMSVSGIFLILFLTFHACMNLVAVFSLEGYDKVCEFLGANWYALVGTAVLAGGFVLHICVATWLTLSNQKARGNDAYDVNGNAPGVSWASKNMYILGFIVLAMLGLHFYMFWAKMQLVEVCGLDSATIDICGQKVVAGPADGGKWLLYWFSQPVMVALYLVWFVALWMHLCHGVWSSFHTLGANNNTWLKRWKTIATVCATIIIGMFAFVVVYFFIATQMNCPCIAEYLAK